MKNLIALLLALLPIASIRADELKIIDARTLNQVTNNINNPAPAFLDNSGESVDFATGIRHDSNENRPKWRSGYEIRQVNDNKIEISCNYATIKTWDMQPGTEYWDISGCLNNPNFDASPLLPYIRYTIAKSDNEELNDFYIEDCDYIDFPDVKCMAGWMVYDPALRGADESNQNLSAKTRSLEIGEIRPYEGFFPQSGQLIYYQEVANNIELTIMPLQYDMENHIMRVNRNITIRRGSKVSGISCTDVDDSHYVYFTFDGRIEPNPKKGVLYIKKAGEKFSKVIF